MMKKHLVEGMVPVLVELKRMLEARRHSLLQQLMLTLRTLLRDHKTEVSCNIQLRSPCKSGSVVAYEHLSNRMQLVTYS